MLALNQQYLGTVGNVSSSPHPRPTESEILGVGAAIYALTSHPGVSDVPWRLRATLLYLVCEGDYTGVYNCLSSSICSLRIRAFCKQVITRVLQFGYISLNIIFNPNLSPPPVFCILIHGKRIHLEAWMRNLPFPLLPLLCSMHLWNAPPSSILTLHF